MRDFNQLLEDSGNPKDWICAVREQFNSIAKQNPMEVISTYQTLKLCLERAQENEHKLLAREIGVFMEATVARMFALCNDYNVGGGSARFQLCRHFFLVTGGNHAFNPSTFE